jgi:THO complex subunit 1
MLQVYNFAGATAHSKLSVLKICNQLLLRLSRASRSELCGRILMFLTCLLPLLDRSGLNVLGQFNTSHSTPVEEVAEVRPRHQPCAGYVLFQLHSRA